MPPLNDILILADAGWLKLLFVVVFFLIWLFNNLVGDQAKGRKARGGARPGQPRPPQVPAGEQPPAQQQLVGEIEEFLQRAKRKRQEKQERTKRRQAVRVEKPQSPPERKPPRRLVAAESDLPDTPAEAVAAMSASVQQHLDTSDFASRASHLGDEDIAKDDAERAAHLQEVFGHQVGRLADTSKPTATAPPSAAPQGAAVTPLAALLANPQSLKQAIVLREILERPPF